MLSQNPLPSLLPLPLVEELAVTYNVDAKNQIRLPGSVVFVCLLHGLLHHPQLTQRLLEETYTKQTGHHADHSSFGKRLEKINPDYFGALYAFLHQKIAPQMTKGDAQALRVRFVDATTVTLSAKLLSFGLLNRTHPKNGKARRHVKSVLALHQDGLPHLLRLCRDKAEHNDCVALGESMLQHTHPGDLWVFDKGCDDRQRLLRLHQAGSFWLTPHNQQAFQNGQTLWQADPETLPKAPPQGEEPTFVLTRVQKAVFGNSQESRAVQAHWNTMPLVLVQGLRCDTRTKQWKTLTLMTNLPLSKDPQQVGGYTFLELATLYRERWAIEALFKFLKQYLSYSHLLSRSENGILVMLYMSLIAALLLIWYQRKTKIDRGWRSVKFWFAHDVSEWTQKALQTVFVPSNRQPDG